MNEKQNVAADVKEERWKGGRSLWVLFAPVRAVGAGQ